MRLAGDLPPLWCRKSRSSGALTYPEPLGPPRPVAGHLYLLICTKRFHLLATKACIWRYAGTVCQKLLLGPYSNIQSKKILNMLPTAVQIECVSDLKHLPKPVHSYLLHNCNCYQTNNIRITLQPHGAVFDPKVSKIRVRSRKMCALECDTSWPCLIRKVNRSRSSTKSHSSSHTIWTMNPCATRHSKWLEVCLTAFVCVSR
jgi:hypothetical protein